MTDHDTEALERTREILRVNAQQLGLSDPRIYVAKSPFGGQRIRVVHDALVSLDDEERRAKLLSGIDTNKIESADLLTSDEEEWYGPPFLETDGPLPTWVDLFEIEPSKVSSPLTFASDLDQDIASPIVVTFYSLRGGVGRTTALASTARILAHRGHRVLCIDMDFEAPGLPHLFGLAEPELKQGALPLLLGLEQGDDIDIRDHVQRVSEGNELYCLPAGKLSADYAQRLRLLDPESWYRDEPNPLHKLLDAAASSSLEPDIILMDTRTGISAISAPLLFDVSDMAIVFFFPHPQAERGTELLSKSMFLAKTRRSVGGVVISPELRYVISPVPPGPSAAEVRNRALSWIDAWLAHVQTRRSAEVGDLQGDELTYFVPYSADTAFKDEIIFNETCADTYGPIADWVEQLLPQPAQAPEFPVASKIDILNDLSFSTGTAEYQINFLEDFVRTRISVQAMDPKFPLVIGRKGTGKTAVFRWLFEQPSSAVSSVAIMCPNAFRNRVPWSIGSEGFKIAERRIEEHGSSWQAFWACYTALAVALSLNEEPDRPTAYLHSEFGTLAGNKNSLDELAVVDFISGMLGNVEAGLLARRSLREMNEGIAKPTFLLFDGLDTGFGNDDASRLRRTVAVTGLFTFLTETENLLPRLPFKVMLRYDIWQQLRFENKSHLYGRSLQLRWGDQAEYFKTVLKQAVRSTSFARTLPQAQIDAGVDNWQQQEVFRAWNTLVGERMKGGKTTFTRNWVWNRLADGQGDHGPRSLSQLFNAAVDWEQREEARSPYNRSIIRPRALVPSLEDVSDEALSALREEFPELESLIGALSSVGRTPLDPNEIANVNPAAAGQLDLAVEVGLLAVHEGTQEEVRRYRVPDLYRLALGMTRRGQA